MRSQFKILIGLVVLFNISFVQAQNLKKVSGQDILAVLAVTCSAKNWDALKKWNGFNYFHSLEETVEVPVLSSYSKFEKTTSVNQRYVTDFKNQ
ncbi:MAG: hypothetical protein H7235_11140 [Bdellovibrionaceae bacterium]|nr:hypothetical protein [Pseudobdellovibrionaceae bacterium]